MDIIRIIEDKYKANSFIAAENNECIIIDMNTNVLPYITDNKLNPKYLFLTHEHFDHIKGTAELKNRYNDMQIISSKITSDLIINSKGNMSFFLNGAGFEECAADIFIEDINTFQFNNHLITTYYTPGHTTGGIIIHIDNTLFTGDTVLNIKTPTTLPNSSKKQLRESIEFIDKNFDDNTLFYQGHGAPFLKKDWNKDISIGVKK